MSIVLPPRASCCPVAHLLPAVSVANSPQLHHSNHSARSARPPLCVVTLSQRIEYSDRTGTCKRNLQPATGTTGTPFSYLFCWSPPDATLDPTPPRGIGPESSGVRAQSNPYVLRDQGLKTEGLSFSSHVSFFGRVRHTNGVSGLPVDA